MIVFVQILRGNVSYEDSIHRKIEDNVTNKIGYFDPILGKHHDFHENIEGVYHKLDLLNIKTGQFDYKQASLDLIDQVLN